MHHTDWARAPGGSVRPAPEQHEVLTARRAWSPSTFHQKLLELLVVGRPVVAFSGEHEESRSLASQCATPFSASENAQALQVALERAWADRDRSPTRKPSSPAWRWSDFAVGLEQFFLDVAGRPAVAHAT